MTVPATPEAPAARGTRIHPSAIVHPDAVLGEGVEIGPWALVGEGCTVGDGCVIAARATLERNVRLGRNVKVGIGTILGGDPQDLTEHPRQPSTPANRSASRPDSGSTGPEVPRASRKYSWAQMP